MRGAIEGQAAVVVVRIEVVADHFGWAVGAGDEIKINAIDVARNIDCRIAKINGDDGGMCCGCEEEHGNSASEQAACDLEVFMDFPSLDWIDSRSSSASA